MVYMTNYPDGNQSEQQYVNNDDYTRKNGRHGHLLLTRKYLRNVVRH